MSGRIGVERGGLAKLLQTDNTARDFDMKRDNWR